MDKEMLSRVAFADSQEEISAPEEIPTPRPQAEASRNPLKDDVPTAPRPSDLAGFDQSATRFDRDERSGRFERHERTNDRHLSRRSLPSATVTKTLRLPREDAYRLEALARKLDLSENKILRDIVGAVLYDLETIHLYHGNVGVTQYLDHLKSGRSDPVNRPTLPS